jgi:biopolymer transport protein ExbD
MNHVWREEMDMVSDRCRMEGSALRVFALILAVFALGMLPLHAAPFQEDENPPEAPGKTGGKVALGLKAGGKVTLDGTEMTWSEVSQGLRAKVAACPGEKVEQHEVSKLEVVIKGETGVQWEDVNKAMFACIRQSIRRISLAHGNVNNGVEIEAWLPVDSAKAVPAVTLQEVRVKLLWTEKLSRKETNDPTQ